MNCCHYYQFSAGGDDLFTVGLSRIRFDPGALRELGTEVALEGVKYTAVFTSSVAAECHCEGATLLGADTADAVPADTGEVLAEHLSEMMQQTDMPNGVVG